MGERRNMTEEPGEIVVQEETDKTVEVIILIPRDSDADWDWMHESMAKFLILHLEQEFISHGRERMKVAVVFAAKSAPFYRKKPWI